MQGPCKIEGTVGCLPARQHRVVSGKVFFLFFLFYLLRNFFFLILPPIKRLCNSDLTLSFLTSILLFKRNSNFTHHLNSLSRFCQSEGLESQWLALNWLSNIDDGERMCLGDHYFALFFCNALGQQPWWLSFLVKVQRLCIDLLLAVIGCSPWSLPSFRER